MTKEEMIELLKAAPDPTTLSGFLPRINGKLMTIALMNNDFQKIITMTLIGILMGVINKLLNENPDWDQYIKLEQEKCDNPDCEICNASCEIPADSIIPDENSKLKH